MINIEEYLVKSYKRASNRFKEKLERGLDLSPAISIEELLTSDDPLIRQIGKYKIEKCIDRNGGRHGSKETE